jgi:glycosyltransferase involved in cell wall biosynthesis
MGGSLVGEFSRHQMAGHVEPSKIRLACVTTHPIQYHAQWFRALAAHPQIDLEVLYCHHATPGEQSDAGFGVEFEWDVPLLDGYKYRLLENVAGKPSVGSFRGLDTPELYSLISAGRYDAVFVNGWHYKSAWQAIRACWKRKVPVMARSDSHLHTKRHLSKRLMKEIPYRWFIAKLDACLAVGSWSREYFLHYGARPDRIFMVPHAARAVSDRDVRSFEGQRQRFRGQWELRASDTVFVFSGKFIGKKRPLDFVRAIGEARRLNPRIVGLMVGDGPLRGECQRLARELDAPIRFSGFLNQSRIAEAYIAADALVLPSDGGETWGLVVNEAMSWGRPCLVSDHVGCGPDLVFHGETGMVFPLGDVKALASHLADCASHTERLISMGKKAQERLGSYSISAAVEGLLQALSRVGVRS